MYKLCRSCEYVQISNFQCCINPNNWKKVLLHAIFFLQQYTDQKNCNRKPYKLIIVRLEVLVVLHVLVKVHKYCTRHNTTRRHPRPACGSRHARHVARSSLPLDGVSIAVGSCYYCHLFCAFMSQTEVQPSLHICMYVLVLTYLHTTTYVGEYGAGYYERYLLL